MGGMGMYRNIYMSFVEEQRKEKRKLFFVYIEKSQQKYLKKFFE